MHVSLSYKLEVCDHTEPGKKRKSADLRLPLLLLGVEWGFLVPVL